jgi:hypothetical protein
MALTVKVKEQYQNLRSYLNSVAKTAARRGGVQP